MELWIYQLILSFSEDNKSEASVNMESENENAETEDTEKIMIIDPETEVSKQLIIEAFSDSRTC